MIQEDKELLLKDLCARLPYGVIYHRNDGANIRLNSIDFERGNLNYTDNVEEREIKPYLRSMSSMTEEEEQYVLDTWSEDSFNNGIDLMYDNYMMLGHAPDFIDWLNAHHFDYRGLIERGLALEAPEGMYRTE